MRKIHLNFGGDKFCAKWDFFDDDVVAPWGYGENISGAISDLIENTLPCKLNGIISSMENAPQNAVEQNGHIAQQTK
jgi:hypothetical protein